MTKTILTTLTVAALITCTANARIGESVDTCSKRYGEPVRNKLDENKTGVAVYDKNDLTIKIHFSKGNADLILYSPGEIARIDLDTANKLLELNGRNKQWQLLTKTEETIYDVRDLNAQHPRTQVVDPILWKTKDETLEAHFSNGKGSLQIEVATEHEKLFQDL